MVRSEVLRVLEEALLAEPGSLADDVILVELPAWDSMAVVAFVGEVADRWNVHVSVDDVSASATVGELVDAVLRVPAQP
jgi:acyl carrier protein